MVRVQHGLLPGGVTEARDLGKVVAWVRLPVGDFGGLVKWDHGWPATSKQQFDSAILHFGLVHRDAGYLGRVVVRIRLPPGPLGSRYHTDGSLPNGRGVRRRDITASPATVAALRKPASYRLAGPPC